MCERDKEIEKKDEEIERDGEIEREMIKERKRKGMRL